MRQLEIPEYLIPKLKELQEEYSTYDVFSFLKEKNAVSMFTKLGIDLYLTFDGRVLVGDYFEEDNSGLREAKNFAEVAMAIVLGAKKQNLPELLSLLPERSADDKDCEPCGSTGWLQPTPALDPFICGKCGGLGWTPLNESGDD